MCRQKASRTEKRGARSVLSFEESASPSLGSAAPKRVETHRLGGSGREQYARVRSGEKICGSPEARVKGKKHSEAYPPIKERQSQYLDFLPPVSDRGETRGLTSTLRCFCRLSDVPRIGDEQHIVRGKSLAGRGNQ